MMISAETDLNQYLIRLKPLSSYSVYLHMLKAGSVPQENLPFKDRYTIQDLENLSGIKAHTLRIWEKRYGLLNPARAGNNVRYYSPGDLKKILNVAALYRHNYKISGIASLSPEQLAATVRKETLHGFTDDFAVHALKLAMLTFNQALFDQAFNQLLSRKPFGDIFRTVFLPFLNEIGLMWQTETLTIAHEHFLSNLIRQKILFQVEQLQAAATPVTGKVFVLFLPANEVHELGLMYSHYELLLKGYHAVYLGQSVPLEALKGMQPVFPEITYITAFTIQPPEEELRDYLKTVSQSLLRKGKDELWISGRKIQALSPKPKLPGITYLQSPEAFLKKL